MGTGEYAGVRGALGSDRRKMMQHDFHRRSAVVTGAGSGIGRATALALAWAGASVVAVDMAESGLAAVERLGGPEIHALAADITDPATPAQILARAGGRVDVLINVAGIMDGFLAAHEVDDETWDRMLAVNLTAPQRLMRAVLPGMLEAGRGTIVNVASEAGLKGGCAGAAYTSKHGLVGLTRNTAFLYATKGIRVNAVAPGPVATGLRPDFRSSLAAERLPDLIKASISGIATAEQIAEAVLWLAGPASGNVTGAILASDGGWSAA